MLVVSVIDCRVLYFLVTDVIPSFPDKILSHLRMQRCLLPMSGCYADSRSTDVR